MMIAKLDMMNPPVSCQCDQTLVYILREAPIGNMPQPHSTVFTGTGDNIVVEWVPFHIW